MSIWLRTNGLTEIVIPGGVPDRQRVLLQRSPDEGEPVQVLVRHDRLGSAHQGDQLQDGRHEARDGLESDEGRA